jgi:phosphoadenosine phosphosulfate reductase
MDHAYFEGKTAEIGETINGYLAAGKKLFVGSSFQTHSIPLLHIVSRIKRNIPVYFIDTGHHFDETLAFKQQIGELLGIEIIDLHSVVSTELQHDAAGTPYFASDPDRCCNINKIQPLQPVLRSHDVWINGIRKDQSETRSQMGREVRGPCNTLRYHPILGWNSKEIFYYRRLHHLPPHPLEEKGYPSIGCEPCTRRPDPMGDERSGRWFGHQKTECGLHTDLAAKGL